MAEFVEVMKQRNRLCEHYLSKYNCNGCPISITNNKERLSCENFIKAYPEKAENIIMEWAAANPEPKPLTRMEVFQKLFPMANVYSIKACHVVTRLYCNGLYNGTCKDCTEGYWNGEAEDGFAGYKAGKKRQLI